MIGKAWLRRFGSFSVSALLFVVIFAAGVHVGQTNLPTAAQTGDLNVAQFVPNTLPPADADDAFAPFWEAYNLIQKNYVDVPDQSVLVDGAIKGLVDALDDQYSGYTEPQFFQYYDSLSGEVQGIGVMISVNEERNLIEVINVFEGTPAQTAGIKEGDFFLTVNDEDVAGMSTAQIAARVRGPEGTTVEITMLRGEEEIDFVIERVRYTSDIANYEYELLDNGIGYIKLVQFTQDARREIDTALDALDARNLDGLILDLRGNPGGLLSTAVNIASAFLPAGEVILIEDFGDDTEQVFEANGSDYGFSGRFVVLVDERSASASELVAGAWQDNGAATIIGATTLGKGTVQTQRELVNGGGLRLTIARWLTPNRNWIHEQGVTPDVEVLWSSEDRDADPDTDPQLEAALDFLREAVGTAD